jgi:N-acetylneuraminate synthase
LFAKTVYASSPDVEREIDTYQLTPKQHREIAEHCRSRDIHFLSSCFSPAEADLLESLDVPAFKIASMDVDHLPLLRYVGGKQKPVILSTGMATLGEVERAVATLEQSGSGPIALLHCVSIYPPRYDSMHLRNLLTLRQAFDLPVGFSDHSLGTAIPLAAVALGACIIEKHFTLDKHLPGWDHAISADPWELEVICRDGRNVFAALGGFVRTVSQEEMEKRCTFRRSLVASRDLRKGHLLGPEDVDYKRPGEGIPPDQAQRALGRALVRDIRADDAIAWADVA